MTANLGSLSSVAAGESNRRETTMNPRLFTFVGGNAGSWAVTSVTAIAGQSLPVVERLEIVHGMVADLAEGAKWALRGVTSNSRYSTGEEKAQMVAKQAELGRPEATHSALIPIRKSPKWWALSQDERRAIFEERSKHIAVGIKYLPAVARRLHHCRDLSESEPFDFITLFDYAKDDEKAFDEMLATMRASEEWHFVDREVDIRLERV
jgi:chlorite dismutase